MYVAVTDTLQFPSWKTPRLYIYSHLHFILCGTQTLTDTYTFHREHTINIQKYKYTTTIIKYFITHMIIIVIW